MRVTLRREDRINFWLVPSAGLQTTYKTVIELYRLNLFLLQSSYDLREYVLDRAGVTIKWVYKVQLNRKSIRPLFDIV